MSQSDFDVEQAIRNQTVPPLVPVKEGPAKADLKKVIDELSGNEEAAKQENAAAPAKQTILDFLSQTVNDPKWYLKPLSIDNKNLLQQTEWKELCPVASFDKLERKSKYFIVVFGGKFHYYKIEAPRKINQNLFLFTTLPKIYCEGLVVIDRNVYFVTKNDLRRGVIRSCRMLKLNRYNVTYKSLLDGSAFPEKKTNSGKAQTPGIQKDGAIGPANILGDPDLLSEDTDERGLVTDATGEELAEANRVFKNQVVELYGIENTEEEWEIQDHPQS